MREFIQKLGRFWGSIVTGIIVSIVANVTNDGIINYLFDGKTNFRWFGFLYFFVILFASSFYFWEKTGNK